MQPIEGRVNEDIAALARLERRSKADMAETHRRNTLERRRPGLKRTGHKRMQMIDVDWNPLIMC